MALRADPEQLSALRRLAEVLDELEELVENCASAKKVTHEDEQAHSALRSEAQVLHGRLSPILGRMVIQQLGRSRDAFQDVLANYSVSRLFNPVPVVEFWLDSLNASRSIVRQRIGALEEMERQGRLGLSPEQADRYRGLINLLERVRRLGSTGMKWMLRPLHLLDPLARRLENASVVRLLMLIGGVGGGVVFIIAVVAVILRS